VSLELLDNDRCKLKELEEEHSNHPEEFNSKPNVNGEVMTRIRELLGLKPQAIVSQLFKEGLQAPTITKLYNITKDLRKEKVVSNAPTLRQIIEWCDNRRQTTRNLNRRQSSFRRVLRVRGNRTAKNPSFPHHQTSIEVCFKN
jgi:hypothetical protein